MRPLTKEIYEKELAPILHKEVELITIRGETVSGIFWPSTTWGDPDEEEVFEIYSGERVITIPVSDTKEIKRLVN